MKEQMAAKLPGRNEPCWCGSGMKFKKCHMGKKPQAAPHSAPFTANLARPNRGAVIKTREQIDGIRLACQLARELLDMLTGRIVPGVTTNAIDTWVEEYTQGKGAISAPLNYKKFPKSVCTSINEVVCHGIPEDRELKAGDIVNVDVSPILGGYFGDSSRMYAVGNISRDAERLVQVTRECLEMGIEQVRPGGFVGDIGHAIQTHAEKHGYSVVRDFVGHGVGLKFHEDPQIPHFGRPGGGPPFIPGMIFTIEPMINAGKWQVTVLEDKWTAVTRDGSLSAQWEHSVLVTENGVEILSAE